MIGDMWKDASARVQLRRVASTGGGTWHGPCPFCGGRDRFAIQPSANRWLCRHCTEGKYASPRRYFELAGLAPERYVLHPSREKPKRQPAWLAHGWAYVRQAAQHPERLTRWQAYKPLAAPTIASHYLGVGALPPYSSRCQHARLLVPLIADGEIVGLRGRAFACDCAKWVNAVGFSLESLPLFGWERVRKGATVLIVENAVDALLLTERTQYVGVATHSTAYWRQAWTDLLAALQPELVIVAYDNDLAGNGGYSVQVGTQLIAGRRAEFVRAWQTARPGQPAPGSAGKRLEQRLLAAGLPARLYPWGQQPHQMDIGALLCQK